jgi:hypothetical protein
MEHCRGRQFLAVKMATNVGMKFLLTLVDAASETLNNDNNESMKGEGGLACGRIKWCEC